jgi:hypothetical protein
MKDDSISNKVTDDLGTGYAKIIDSQSVDAFDRMFGDIGIGIYRGICNSGITMAQQSTIYRPAFSDAKGLADRIKLQVLRGLRNNERM